VLIGLRISIFVFKVYVVRNTKAVCAARDAANQGLSKRGKPV
jgi:hypothetical protein